MRREDNLFIPGQNRQRRQVLPAGVTEASQVLAGVQQLRPLLPRPVCVRGQGLLLRPLLQVPLQGGQRGHLLAVRHGGCGTRLQTILYQRRH